jgi:hypothetical protein
MLPEVCVSLSLERKEGAGNAGCALHPARTIAVEKCKTGMPFSFSGRIEAEGEVAFAFRISGRLFENSGKRWRLGAARAGKAD